MSFYQEYLRKQKNQDKETPKEEGVDSITDIVPSPMPVKIANNTKSKFSEIQKREEVERQNFISRVKGENVPLPEIAKNELKEENIRISVPQRPARSEKILIRIIIILVLLVILAAISLLWYRTVRDGVDPTEAIREVEIKEVFVPEIIAPASLFNYDFFEYLPITRSNEFSTHLLQFMAIETEEEVLAKVTFRDQRDPRNPTFMTTNDFLSTFSITMPPPFGERVNQESLNLFMHFRDESNEVGFAVVINNTEGFTEMMRGWENNAARDMNQFLSLLGKETATKNQIFAPIIHRQNVIRCLNYQNDSEVCYSMIKDSVDIFVFATSLDTVRNLIDSL